MGLFKKLQSMAGGVSSELMNNGLLGRGQIVGVEQTRVSTGGDDNPHPVCVFTVQVALDNVAPYEAKCRQSVPMMVLPQLGSGQAVVAVRVNPNDHNEIALDLNTEPPVVTMAAGSGQETAADILAKGSAARAVIVQSNPLGMKNPAGVDLYGFQLTVMVDGRAPYQIQVGNPVPPEAVPLLYPGSNVPAKAMPGSDNSVAIDWAAAIEEQSHQKK
jgi:hypothetical protein